MAKQELTDMQQKFCELYVECGNATESALGAGYCSDKPKNASVQGSKLMTMPKIKKEIARIRFELGIDTRADKDLVMEALLKMINDPKTEPQHMLQAVDKLSRLMGWLKEGATVEINNHNVEKISDEELTRRLAQMEEELKDEEENTPLQ